MILSVSRRTDIPALYGSWFMNRLRTGEVLVRNPMNPRQVSSIPLSPDNIDCIVFWTKNPGPFLAYIDEVEQMGYSFYFTVTITSYGRPVERALERKDNIMESFISLSRKIGPERVIWRYDPILYSPDIDFDYHKKWFAYIAEKLSGHTEKCVFSFLRDYKKISSEMKFQGIKAPDDNQKMNLICHLSKIAINSGMQMASCSQELDYSRFGVKVNSCVDKSLIERITGSRLSVKKDPSQRSGCGCVQSRDVGTYNTCTNGCVYCYAGLLKDAAAKKAALYDEKSPMLCDSLVGNENISQCADYISLKSRQKELFDL